MRNDVAFACQQFEVSERLARRSGRIPALPYPPAKCVQRISSRMDPFCRYYGTELTSRHFLAEESTSGSNWLTSNRASLCRTRISKVSTGRSAMNV